jgi:hypothetical protein
VSFFSFSQVEKESLISNHLKKLQAIFDSVIQNSNLQELKNSSDSSLINYLSNLRVIQNQNFDYQAYYLAKENLLKRDLSLNLTLDGIQNFNANQFDLEDNILYQRRYQAGIEWDILSGGYFDNKNEIEKNRLEQSVEEELNKYKNTRRDIPIKMNNCINWFNFQKIEFLNKRAEILQKQSELIDKLYFSKKISKDFVLKNQTRLAEINAMKSIYSSYNDFMNPNFDSLFYSIEPGLFDLNYNLFLTENTENFTLDSLSISLKKVLEQQNKWFQNIRLKTYTRYNYFDLITTNPASRSFVSAGVGATIPLRFSHKEQLNFEKEKLNKQLDLIEQNSINKRIELLNEAYEYRYQLKQYVGFHQKKILLNEGIRQERVKAKLMDADFNPLHGLELIDDLYKVEIELLDLKQNLYIKLLKIHEKLNGIPMQDLIEPFFLPNYFSLEDELNRSVYIWTKTFETESVEFLSEYILYNQFDEIQLAVSKDDIYKKEKNQLIEILKRNKLKINLMFGQNDLLDSKNLESEMKNILAQYELKNVDGIHLDIEPHVRPNWKTNQAEEKLKYKNVLKVTNSLVNSYNIRLSVDLPIFLDSIYVKEIMNEVNFVKFMCYENIKMEYLIRKISPFTAFKNKLSISLRTEDFSSRNEMEEFAKKLSKETDIKAINFHDLMRMINLDKKTLEIDEKH